MCHSADFKQKIYRSWSKLHYLTKNLIKDIKKSTIYDQIDRNSEPEWARCDQRSIISVFFPFLRSFFGHFLQHFYFRPNILLFRQLAIFIFRPFEIFSFVLESLKFSSIYIDRRPRFCSGFCLNQGLNSILLNFKQYRIQTIKITCRCCSVLELYNV